MYLTHQLTAYLGQVQTVVSTIPKLVPVANSGYLRWVWNPNINSPLASFYKNADKALVDPVFEIDSFSFRKHPIALQFSFQEILSHLATLPNAAVQKSLLIAWRYLPPGFDFPNINTATQELLGVSRDRWEELAHEGLSLLVRSMSTKPERFRLQADTNRSMLSIIQSIASAKISKVNGRIYNGTTRAEIARQKLRTNRPPPELMAPNIRTVAAYLDQTSGTPNLKQSAAELGLTPSSIDNALKVLSKGLPKVPSYHTNSSFISGEDRRGKLIQAIAEGDFEIKDLDYLSKDETLALALLIDTNDQMFYLNTEELSQLWKLQHPDSTEFNAGYWAKQVQKKLQMKKSKTSVDKESATGEDDSVKGLILQQLKDRLIQKSETKKTAELSPVNVIATLPATPVTPTIVSEVHKFSQPEILTMVEGLVREYKIKIPRKVKNPAEVITTALQQAGVVFINNIPVDTETFELLGWLLNSGLNLKVSDLQSVTGYKPDIITARSTALEALQKMIQDLPYEQKMAEMRRIQSLVTQSHWGS